MLHTLTDIASASLLTSSFRCRRWRARRAGIRSRRDPWCVLRDRLDGPTCRRRLLTVTSDPAATLTLPAPDQYHSARARRRHLNTAHQRHRSPGGRWPNYTARPYDAVGTVSRKQTQYTKQTGPQTPVWLLTEMGLSAEKAWHRDTGNNEFSASALLPIC